MSQSRFHLFVGAMIAVTLTACDPPPTGMAEEEFEQGVVAGVELNQPTSMAVGPDGRLFVAQLDGGVVAVTLDEGGTSAVDVEEVVAADTLNQVLGMTFDPSAESLYLSHNFVNGTADSPFQNEIVAVEGPDWSQPETVISGLPVSGHNHGTNALRFGSDGRLYIAQGGTTSLGAPSTPDDERWRDWDETPLSGAVLVADVTAANFDGNIVYSSAEADSETELLSGDVEVFSPGHRNTYGMIFHSNGNLYTIDNGSSEPLPLSIDCETEGPPPDNDPDQLNLVREGAYYGHPNRNRARTDPRQCEYVSPSVETEDSGMLLLVPPSSNAVIEFTSDAFEGSWRGDLIYAWWSGGEIRHVDLSEDGQSVEGEEIVATDLALPLALVQVADGTIYSANFGDGSLTYLRPEE